MAGGCSIVDILLFLIETSRRKDACIGASRQEQRFPVFDVASLASLDGGEHAVVARKHGVHHGWPCRCERQCCEECYSLHCCQEYGLDNAERWSVPLIMFICLYIPSLRLVSSHTRIHDL